MRKDMKRKIITFACVLTAAVTIAGCGGASKKGENGYPQGTTDELFSDSRFEETLIVYRRSDGNVYTLDSGYEIPELNGREDIRQEGTYQIIADVTYLNGGVAGYVDYPQIDRIISVEEIIPEDKSDEVTEDKLALFINGEETVVLWEDNASVSALKEIAENEPIEIQMSKYGSFEQVGEIGQSIPAEDSRISTAPGDIMLYEGNKIVIFYDSNSWEYTRLGKIKDKSPEEIRQMLGDGDVVIKIIYRADS